MISAGHAAQKVRGGKGPGRFSGLGLVGLFVPLAVSGVLIQILTHEGWLRIVVWAHLLAGILFLGIFTFHRLVTTRRARRQASFRPAGWGTASRMARG